MRFEFKIIVSIPLLVVASTHQIEILNSKLIYNLEVLLYFFNKIKVKVAILQN